MENMLVFSILLFVSNHLCTIAQIQWNGNWARSCDFRGNDFSNVRIPSEQCGGRCEAIQECTHFAWNRHEGGTCWLKRGSISRNNAFVNGDSSSVCGVTRESGPDNGGGQSGITTRYWDCCKVSCAWPGKVRGNSQANLKTCSKDGYNILNNQNAASGCGGGEAFTCNNQQPWAVNDQLAYGFAAATIPGLSEQDRCCTCYKLDFTSGGLNGKSMIVQVTNSGSDVHPNQFDLQIPGGGVGIYNGCSAQWNAPGNGWGQRYGGVSRVEECNQLPGPLQNGCRFRFGWMKGSDNPNMVYRKVNCPRELTDITGCFA